MRKTEWRTRGKGGSPGPHHLLQDPCPPLHPPSHPPTPLSWGRARAGWTWDHIPGSQDSCCQKRRVWETNVDTPSCPSASPNTLGQGVHRAPFLARPVLCLVPPWLTLHSPYSLSEEGHPGSRNACWSCHFSVLPAGGSLSLRREPSWEAGWDGDGRLGPHPQEGPRTP